MPQSLEISKPEYAGRHNLMVRPQFMSIPASIIFGVVSSLIATALFVLLTIAFNRIVVPWFRDLVYKGVRLTGKWEYVLKLRDPAYQRYILELEQQADRLSGTLTIYGKVGDVEDISTHRLIGCLRDGLVFGTLSPINPYSMNHCSFLFSVVEPIDRINLEGSLCYYDSESRRVQCVQLDFKRSVA